MLDLKQKLVRISAELEPEDLTSIKFLCHDDISQNALNKIEDGLEFFWELERLGKINFSRGEIDYLLECLYRCHRIDLIKQMGFDQDIVHNRVNSGNSSFSAFRLLLFEIADDMDEEDFKRSLFLSGTDIPGSKRGKIKSIQDLFIILQKSDKISPENVNMVNELCRFQSSLTWKVQAYQEQLSTGTYLTVNTNQPLAEPSPVHRAGTSSEVQVPVLAPENGVLMEEQSPKDSGLTSGNESVSNKNSQEIGPGGNSQQNQQDDVMLRHMGAVAIGGFYKMDAKPRGVAIIINNKEFQEIRKGPSGKDWSDRIGSEKDAENLSNTWNNLGFNVRMHNNLDSVSMIKTLREASHEDHSKYDCLVVCILSHGHMDYICGSDGKSVKINHLTGFFSGRKSLVGKPKLFFLQACRGDKTQKGHAIRTDAGGSYPDEEQDFFVDGPKELIPEEADFLLGYATVPGYVSYRYESGSLYISILTNNLDKFADKLDLLAILTIVNDEVGQQVSRKGGKKQIPESKFTLRKKVFFKYM